MHLVPTILAALAAAAADATAPSTPTAAVERVEVRLEKLKAKYGDAMLYEVDEKRKLLFALGLDRRSLEEVKQRLTAHEEALQRDLFKHGLPDYLAVIVPRQWANPKVTGHFYPDRVDARTIGSSLMHEFTHALHYADQVGRNEFQPVWIMEGLASLFEQSRVVDGHAVPRLDHRLAELQQEVRDKKYLAFPSMMKLEHRRFTSHHYAQARYMCLYLHDTGRLTNWYAAYTADFAADPSGAAAMEKVCGKKIGEIETDWVAWLLKLTPPRLAIGPGAAGLGVVARQQADGVEIADLLPQGAAERAGLAAGDVLMRVAGERTIEGEDLVAALGRHKAGDEVKVEYRRAGEYREAVVKLAALPATAEPAAEPAPRSR